MVDLDMVKFQTNMNRLFTLTAVKKIIENIYLKEYNLCLIFENLGSTMCCDEIKLEMFCGEMLRGYMMERKFIFKKVNYKTEQLNCQ
jgi:hypothetical protein